MVTVEGHHGSAADDVAAAVDDLQALLRAHASPAAMTAAVLDAGQPVFAGLDAG
jgi:hypothetical protein